MFLNPNYQAYPNGYAWCLFGGGDLVKRRIVIICGVLAIIIIGICITSFLNGNKPIAPDGQYVTEDQLLGDLKKLNKVELKILNMVLRENGYFSDRTILNDQGIVQEGSKNIEIDAQNKGFEFKKGVEIRGAMRTWLYIHRHKFDPSIEGVFLYFYMSWVMDGHTKIVVSREEFEELLSVVDHRDSLSDEELIDQVANLWITKNNYTPKIM